MAPNFADRDPGSHGRMKPLTRLAGNRIMATNNGGDNTQVIRQAPMFVIGNKAFFLAVKRALDIAGGFHIVGAFRMDDLERSLKRSTMLGQTPLVAVIHEPPGERRPADAAAHAILRTYPTCGIVLLSGDELAAENERKMSAHDYKAVVAPESSIRNPVSLARHLRTAINETGASQRVA